MQALSATGKEGIRIYTRTSGQNEIGENYFVSFNFVACPTAMKIRRGKNFWIKSFAGEKFLTYTERPVICAELIYRMYI